MTISFADLGPGPDVDLNPASVHDDNLPITNRSR
jgi:hypothetical protein